MAELLVLLVVAGLVLLYAADRARKLRARARRMGAMNDRLDAAAAKVDKQQARQQARVKASAELTSVLPAIKRPPLTLPGVPGPATEAEEAEPAAAEPEAGPAAAAASVGRQLPAAQAPAAGDDAPAAAGGPPAAADAGNTPDGVAAKQGPAAQAPPDARDNPADEVAPEPVGAPEGTLTMGKLCADATPAPKLHLTSDGTLIMPPVPGQGPAPAGARPAAPRGRPRAS
ncbi:MAG TPA: hypothetical protein VHT94_12795 [Streptosporangiaceae bacterium]|nr:hypothetical protein [Streptosporangiaceae bacterium]